MYFLGSEIFATDGDMFSGKISLSIASMEKIYDILNLGNPYPILDTISLFFFERWILSLRD